MIKKGILIGILTAAVVAAGLLFPKLAWAPHIKESKSIKKSESSCKGKSSVVYAKCPHCGKTIKLHITK